MQRFSIWIIILTATVGLGSCVVQGDKTTEPVKQLTINKGAGFGYQGFALGASRDFVLGALDESYDQVVEMTDHVAHSSILTAMQQNPDMLAPTAYLTVGFSDDTVYAIMDYAKLATEEATLIRETLSSQYGPPMDQATEEMLEFRTLSEVLAYYDNPNHQASHWYDTEHGCSMSMFVELKQTVGGPIADEPTAESETTVDGAAEIPAETPEEESIEPAPTVPTKVDCMIYVFDLAAADANYDSLTKLQ